jgi:predicted RND superfamily exporter protein
LVQSDADLVESDVTTERVVHNGKATIVTTFDVSLLIPPSRQQSLMSKNALKSPRTSRATALQEAYVVALFSRVGKTVTVVLGLLLLGLAIYGLTFVRAEFRFNDHLLDDSPLREFSSFLGRYFGGFNSPLELNFADVDLSCADTRSRIEGLYVTALASRAVVNDTGSPIFFYPPWMQYAGIAACNLDTTAGVADCLSAFLATPEGQLYNKDVVFKSGSVVAFRARLLLAAIEEYQEALPFTRELSKLVSDAGFSHSECFFYSSALLFATFSDLTSDIFQSTVINAVLAVGGVGLLFFHPLVALLVFVNVVLIAVHTTGALPIWGYPIGTATIVIFVRHAMPWYRHMLTCRHVDD